MGEGSYNDTFAMTRKDEELLVGSILQKIVVPHPTINDLEGIEASAFFMYIYVFYPKCIKYTNRKRYAAIHPTSLRS